MRNSRLLISLIEFFVKNPKAILIALLFGGLNYSYELFFARDTMSLYGVPKAIEFSSSTFTRTFRNDAYMVGYSDLRGNPLWVVYKLTPPKADNERLKRPDGFSADWRNFWLITQNDYTNSGFDRGHMAPNHAISTLYGAQAQKETFLMTNITPQRPSLNQKLWKQMEIKELDEFTLKFKELWVYTGPIFEGKTKRLKSSMLVEIPDAFYKIYVGVKENSELKALAFIVPQNAKESDRLEKYAVSIDEVQRKSGFDFLHELEDGLEKKLESKVSKSLDN